MKERKIRVGFGVTVLARGLSTNSVDGIGTYTKELLRSYLANDLIEVKPYSFATPFLNECDIDTLLFPKFSIVATSSLVTKLPFYGTKRMSSRVDIVHATDHLIPNFGKIPTVATIYDAIPISNPEWLKKGKVGLKVKLWKKTAAWANHVITISEYSKQQIQEHFGINENKISITPLGVDLRWFNVQADKTAYTALLKFSLPDQYYLFVGTLQPRKNIARVIDAYQLLPDNIKNHIPLVIIGRHGWSCDQLVIDLMQQKYGKNVIWLQHISDEDLLRIMKFSVALVFPSLAEGFGLPVIEAFASQIPVITSNTTSLPEIAGNAALLINPLDIEAISEAMQKIVEQRSVAETLKSAGLQRAHQFTWEQTAQLTHEVYNKLI